MAVKKTYEETEVDALRTLEMYYQQQKDLAERGLLKVRTLLRQKEAIHKANDCDAAALQSPPPSGVLSVAKMAKLLNGRNKSILKN